MVSSEVLVGTLALVVSIVGGLGAVSKKVGDAGWSLSVIVWGAIVVFGGGAVKVYPALVVRSQLDALLGGYLLFFNVALTLAVVGIAANAVESNVEAAIDNRFDPGRADFLALAGWTVSFGVTAAVVVGLLGL